MLDGYGYDPPTDEESAYGLQKRYRFIPLSECTAKIVQEERSPYATFLDVHTFSFADLDPSQLTGWKV